MKRQLVLIFILLICHHLEIVSQNLEAIGKKKPIQINGGLSADTRFYATNQAENRMDPFVWTIGANLNFNIYDVSIPFSATLSQQDRNFTQPFNQYGLSPYYKGITLHLGYRSLFLSNYTLSGNTFLGVGIEINAQKSIFQFSAMYGRFSRAVQQQDTLGNIIGVPTYERWGWGGKFSVGKKDRIVDFIMFKGRDDPNSLLETPENLGIDAPAENLVMGLVTQQKISSKWKVNLEYSFSAYNADVRSSEAEIENYSYLYLGDLFTPNASAQFNKAIVAVLGYHGNNYSLNFGYRRIDPQYKTLGSPFLNNDLEDITGNISFALLKGKLNISTTGGFQRNNLDKSQDARLIRLVGSVNANYSVNENLNLTGTLSNFNSSTQMQRLNEFDSLNYYQVTNSFGAGANYSFKEREHQHSFSTNHSIQLANDIQQNKSSFYNATISYTVSITPSQWNINTFINYTTATFAANKNNNASIGGGISKGLLEKKIRVGLFTSITSMSAPQNANSLLNNFRINGSYKLTEKSMLNASIFLLNRSASGESSFNEMRVNLRYNYSF